jgi:signal transduction histidine kinase
VLINDILDISKLESGKLDLEHEPFEVQKVVRQVVQMHASKAKSKGLKLMLSYDLKFPIPIFSVFSGSFPFGLILDKGHRLG